MAPIVIYGNAVQDARNRLRSAQISTMVEVLRNALFAGTDETAATFAKELQADIMALPAPPAGNARAQAALSNAQDRIAAFVSGNDIRDVFAVGDALRYVGEYMEFGGAPQTVEAFRAGLRNAQAFNRSNRARIPVADYVQTERPDLGLFKWQLTDSSVVKYMERFYGSYLGADISGTTTDALAALSYLMWIKIRPNPTQENLQFQAEVEIATGRELVPIAAMVLQYHHSLLECGLALALTSTAMANKPAIASYNLYDYATLVNSGSAPSLDQLLTNGNQTLASDLGGYGLAVIRDFIDIDGADYANCEIALLTPNPAGSAMFSIGTQYQTFADGRRGQAVGEDGGYAKGDPTLRSIATGFAALTGLDTESLTDLTAADRSDLDGMKAAAPTVYFDNLDAALATATAAQPRAPQPQVSAAAPAAPPAGPSPSRITANQIQDLKKALAIVQLLEG